MFFIRVLVEIVSCLLVGGVSRVQLLLMLRVMFVVGVVQVVVVKKWWISLNLFMMLLVWDQCLLLCSLVVCRCGVSLLSMLLMNLWLLVVLKVLVSLMFLLIIILQGMLMWLCSLQVDSCRMVSLIGLILVSGWFRQGLKVEFSLFFCCGMLCRILWKQVLLILEKLLLVWNCVLILCRGWLVICQEYRVWMVRLWVLW